MTADHIQDIRTDRGAFDRALEALGVRQKGKSASCPWHHDNNPSASILEAADGTLRIFCHVCRRSGDVFDLREQAGAAPVADQLRALRVDTRAPRRTVMPNPPSRVLNAPKVYPELDVISAMLGGAGGIGRIVSSYEYVNPDSMAIELVVFRIAQHTDGKKTFRQASPCAGGWKCEAPSKPWPLYRRAEIRAAPRVVVVEGESCVDTLEALGIAATTSPCGAGKAEHADWRPLADKEVILWPDHDASGAKHMEDVRRILEGLPNPPRLSIISPGKLGLAPKGDVVDFVASLGRDHAELQRIVNGVIDDADSLGASGDVGRLLEDAIAGRRKAIAWPWPRLTGLSRSLLPGTLTIVCGDPGCGKSFLLLEAAAAWHGQGERVALLELEEDRAYHLRRAFAQQAGNSLLFDDDWVGGHPAQVRAAHGAHRGFLDSFGRQVFDSVKPMKLSEVADWIEGRARAGARLIGVDPLTAAATSDKPWIDGLDFMMKVKAVAKETGASVVLVVHPKRGQRGRVISLDDMAGGAAYQRFAQSVLWVEAFDSKSVSIGGNSASVNRSVAILKARNGPGHGARIGFQFQAHTLRFAEVGLIDATPKEEKVSGRRHHNHEPRLSEDQFHNHEKGAPP